MTSEERIKALAERFPWVSVQYGDGSESASGFKGWSVEIVTGIPYGAVIEEDFPTLEAALDAAETEVNRIVAGTRTDAYYTEPER